MRMTAWLAVGVISSQAMLLVASCGKEPRCGDGVLADCTAPVCGDGHVNRAAGEVCDSAGVDTPDCDADCTAVECDDGHVNRVAGEQCETHADCPGARFCAAPTAPDACTCVP